MLLALVVTLAILLHLAFAGSRVALSLFAINLGASPFTIGVLVSLFALLPMTFSVAAGGLIDRIGVRKPMLMGAASLFIGIMLIVISPNLQTLFIASCFIGSGSVLFHIAVHYVAAVIGRPKDRARNFSWLALGFFLGTGLGGTQPMIMSLLYNKAPPGRGAEAIGVHTLLVSISQTTIPLLFGALGAVLGMMPVFWTMAAPLVGGGYVLRKP